jgi:hypothetical protein
VRLHGALWHARLAWALSLVSAALVSYICGIRWWRTILAIVVGTPLAFTLIQMVAVFTAAPGLDIFPQDDDGTSGKS